MPRRKPSAAAAVQRAERPRGRSCWIATLARLASVFRRVDDPSAATRPNWTQNGNATSRTSSGCPVRHVPRNVTMPVSAPIRRQSRGAMASARDADAMPPAIQIPNRLTPTSPISLAICRKLLCAFSVPYVQASTGLRNRCDSR